MALFEAVDATLRLDQLAQAAAATISETIARRGWTSGVIVAAWSALGNIAPRLNTALSERGIELRTFVSLAATPPLPNLILGSNEASAATVDRAEHYTRRRPDPAHVPPERELFRRTGSHRRRARPGRRRSLRLQHTPHG